MDTSKKSVVSMLTSADKLTLFTETGEVIAMVNDGTYDMPKILEYLTPKLTGTSAVEIDLVDFTFIKASINQLEVESEGIIVVQMINGKEVQGIFYPQKTSVIVKVGNEHVTIPDVENLSGHMQRAAEEKSPSVSNFFKRLAPVIQSRKHSGEDLMKFIKRSEMPLTNDGRIIAYKRVNRNSEGVYKDCHTGRVLQRVGSRVTMPVKLVDSSRTNSCSTGLHVCNLGYLKGFSGSHTLVVLVNPEDFIAVPHGEDTKARVCSYDIVGVMDNAGHIQTNTGASVKDNQSFESMISDIVQGKVITPFEVVNVTGSGDTTTTPITGVVAQAVNKSKDTAPSGKPLDEVKSTSVDLVQLAKETKTQAIGFILPPEVAEAFQRLRDGDSKAEVARKLQTSTRSIGRWIEKYGEPSSHAVTAPQEATPEPLILTKNLRVGEGSVSQQAQAFFGIWLKAGTANNLKNLLDFKKAKKKSWDALGFTGNEIVQIEKAAKR